MHLANIVIILLKFLIFERFTFKVLFSIVNGIKKYWLHLKRINNIESNFLVTKSLGKLGSGAYHGQERPHGSLSAYRSTYRSPGTDLL